MRNNILTHKFDNKIENNFDGQFVKYGVNYVKWVVNNITKWLAVTYSK